MGLLDRLFGPPSRDKFAASFIAALREAGDQREAVYDPQEFRLEYAGGGGYTFLGNFYDEYCALPRSERPNCLRLQVRGSLSHLKEMPEEFEDAKCDIYPKIWTRATLEKMRLQQRLNGGDPPNIPTQLIGEHLEVSLAYDLPEAVRTISQGDLDDWGVSYYEAMEFAQRNLESTEFSFAGIGESLYASLTGDTYDATRLLRTDLIQSLDVQGEHIAMVPNRDSLLITGSEDEDGLGMMFAFAEKKLTDEPRPMIATPLKLAGDEWADWMPPEGHPLWESFRALELRFLYQEYDDQKSILDAAHEREGIGTFVASFTAIQKKDTDQLVSYCTWSPTEDALLPQAQKVVFIRGEDDIPAVGRWEHVMSVVGHRMEPTDYYPPRFRVSGLPSDEELAAIGMEDL